MIARDIDVYYTTLRLDNQVHTGLARCLSTNFDEIVNPLFDPHPQSEGPQCSGKFLNDSIMTRHEPAAFATSDRVVTELIERDRAAHATDGDVAANLLWRSRDRRSEFEPKPEPDSDCKCATSNQSSTPADAFMHPPARGGLNSMPICESSERFPFSSGRLTSPTRKCFLP
ncbi:MAG: hypothetical protein VYC68_02545 [Candidatus Thermoplasmatota archaeon]|nr:hypothetical protein [Candidatus Thermoplasmatota archaeon]